MDGNNSEMKTHEKQKKQIKTGAFEPIPGKFLILGSRATYKSLKREFFYTSCKTDDKNANIIWQILDFAFYDGKPVLRALIDNYIDEFDKGSCSNSKTASIKKEIISLLHKNGIGLSDVIFECESSSSLDNDIYNLVPSPHLDRLVKESTVVLLNGTKAGQIFKKLICQGDIISTVRYIVLPSTSRTPGKNVKKIEERINIWKNAFNIG